jgi:lambda repressor-like predicted transcriptional regulator
MNSIEIKILLYRKRRSIASIARDLGVTDAAIHHVINGRRPSRRVRMAIAKAVGKRVEELWPSKSFKKAA